MSRVIDVVELWHMRQTTDAKFGSWLAVLALHLIGLTWRHTLHMEHSGK